MATLDERLKNEEYRHWVKAVLCLQYTKEGLVSCADRKSKDLHNAVLAQIRGSGNPSANGICSTAAIKKGAIKCCGNCNAFLVEAKRYCIGTLNLNNIDITNLHKQPWQLAKLFMNPGQDVATTYPGQTDLSGILNFFDHCTQAKNAILNTPNIKDVRDTRNTLLHTADMKITKHNFSTKIIPTLMALLQDPGYLATDQAAQDAVMKINEVVAADFHITKENEEKILKEFATEFRCLSKDLSTKIDDLQTELDRVKTNIGQTMKAQEDKQEKELQDRQKDKQTLQEMKEQQDRLENELQDKEKDKQKLENSLRTLEQKIKGDAELVRMLGTDVTEIKFSLEKNRQDIHKNRQDIDKLTTKTEKDEREREQLKRKLDDMAAEQADMAADSKKVKKPVTEDDKAQLQQYLVKGYEDSKLDVPTLHSCHALPIGKIFAPVVLSRDREFLNQEHGRGETRDSLSEKLRSYTELFFKEGNLQKRIFLLGKAGAGKTTLCKHLTDLWCDNSVCPQFEDAKVMKLFRCLFNVSCRFAEASESIFDMICNQLLCENDEMIEIARQVLKDTPNECLVLIDGIDEWKGSVNTATGRRGDIPGLPSRRGLEECAVLSTSRPERIHMLPTKLDKTCSVLELHGIQEVSQLICSILREAEEYPDPQHSCSEFLTQVEQSHLNDLIEFPLMLINALNLWEMNKALSNSMSVNYSNMMEGLFARAKDADRLKEYEQEGSQEISAKLPDCFRQTDWCKRKAGLLIKLGQLAFDLLFGDDQNSSLIFSEKQIRKYLTEAELKICLAVGILSKAQTISRSNRKNTSFSFCHKTFQEFLGALWLSREQSELKSIFRNTDSLLDNVVFIQSLYGISPITGDRFWQYIAEEVTEKDEKIKKWRLDSFADWWETKVLVLQNLILQCINEARNTDLEQYRQLYYFIPDIFINRNTDERDITLINGMVEKYVADIKSVTLHDKISSDIVNSMNKMQSAISIRLQGDRLNRPSMPELQFPDQLKLLYVMWVNIPSAIKFPKHLTSLTVNQSKLSHSGIEQLCSCLRVSSTLRSLDLSDLSCSDHGGMCCLPALDLQTHHLTSFSVGDITLSHNAIEQLCSCLRVSSTLRYLTLVRLSCSDHGHLPALDLQTHHSLETVTMWEVSIESVLLPGQLERQQAGDLHGIPTLKICMITVNMSSQGWRSWLDSLPHPPYRLKVELSYCNIDEDRKSYIRSCSHFTVTWDGTDTFDFETKQGQ